LEACVAQRINAGKIKKQLTVRRAELLEGVARARDMGSVETGAAAPDIADRASSAFQREFSYSLSENENKMLRLIDEALDRLEAGTYGQCTNCEKVIEPQRLQAIPWARHCIACQEQQDRGEL
jgi:DnaK suppressor protein